MHTRPLLSGLAVLTTTACTLEGAGDGPFGPYDAMAPAGAHMEVVVGPGGRLAQVVPGPDRSALKVDGVTVVDGPGRPRRPMWSPEGRRLAFVSGASGVVAVWIVDLATGIRVQITNVGLKSGDGIGPDFVPPPTRASSALWTDSDHLVWNAGDSVWSCTVRDRRCHRLLRVGATPTSSEAGVVTLVNSSGFERRVRLQP